MEEIITAYKGFNKDLTCRDFQYEVGKEYELLEGEIVRVCSKGFHACESPLEVLDYYFMDDNANLLRFCEVEQSGKLFKSINYTKVASSKIKIKAEIKFADLIKLGVEWLKEKTSPEKVDAKSKSSLNDGGGYNAQISSSGNDTKIGSSGNGTKIGSSGNYAQIGSSGNYAQIGSSGNDTKIGSSGNGTKISSSGNYAKIGSSGNYAKIGSSGNYAKIGSSGNYAQISSSGNYAKIGSSGNYAKISSSGNYAKISSSGNYAKISSSCDNVQIDSTGEYSVIMCAGYDSKAKAKKGSWITLVEWYDDKKSQIWKPACVKTEYVDGVRIKEDTWYKLTNGEFVEVALV